MTLTEVANQALEELGALPINSIRDADKTARLCAAQIRHAMRKVQAMAVWGELVKKIKLVQAGDGEYLLPNGCLRVVDVNGRRRFAQEDNRVRCLAPQAVARCVIYSENPNKWSTELLLAIVAQLKADLAFPLTNSPQVAAQVRQAAQSDIQSALYEAAANRQPLRRYGLRSDWQEDW